jgi:outer membrane protein assembly factor BamB
MSAGIGLASTVVDRAQAPEVPTLGDVLDARWAFAAGAPLSAPPAFDDRRAYLPLRSGALIAVDLARGLVRWRVSLQTQVTPATGEERVFVEDGGWLVALESDTGNALWRTPLPGRVAAPLSWDTGWLLASTDAGDLAAFRASDGSLVWRQSLGAPLALEPAPALDKLYCALSDGRLVAVDLGDGTRRWETRLEGRATGLAVVGEQLIVGTTGNAVLSFDLAGGRVRWRWRVGADVVGRAAADDRYIYFVALDNVVRAVDRRSGNLRWSRPIASRPGSGPLRLADVVLVPFVSNQLIVLAPNDGRERFTVSLPDELSSPPHIRRAATAAAVQIITVGRDGTLLGLAPRLEPPPAPLDVLPGRVVAQ